MPGLKFVVRVALPRGGPVEPGKGHVDTRKGLLRPIIVHDDGLAQNRRVAKR